MAEKIQLKDKDGVKQYPVTLTNAVIDSEGRLLEDRMKTLESKLDSVLNAFSWKIY